MLEKGKYYSELPMEYLSELLKFEGELSKDRCDKGNWYKGELKGTNMGVTFATLVNAKQKQLVPYSVTIETLTKENVRMIYNDLYYLRQHCDKIPHPLSFCVLDCSINCGKSCCSRILQKCVNNFLTDKNNHVKIDNAIGEKTLAGLQLVLSKGIDIQILCNTFNTMRSNYYDAIVANNPKQGRYLNGWKNRLSNVVQLCKQC